MKLTSQQLTAIANKITREVNDEINKINRVVYAAEELIVVSTIKSQLTTLEDTLKKLPFIATGKITYGHYTFDTNGNSYGVEQIVKGRIKDKLVPILSLDKVKEDLIIGTIEAADMDQLIKSLKEKYLETTH